MPEGGEPFHCTRHVSGITSNRYAQSQKTGKLNTLKVKVNLLDRKEQTCVQLPVTVEKQSIPTLFCLCSY
jgi:hypothetical protein